MFRLENELDFVFHRNRLNVALSRAKNLCILIASKTVMEPPIAALATPERRQAFAHLKFFGETSHVVPWRVSVEGLDAGGPPGDSDGEEGKFLWAEEEDVWADAMDDLELFRLMEGVEKMQLGRG